MSLVLAIGLRNPSTGTQTLVGANGATGTAALPTQNSGNTSIDSTLNGVVVPGNAIYLGGAAPNDARNCITVINQSAFEVFLTRDFPVDHALGLGISGSTGAVGTSTTLALPPGNDGATGTAPSKYQSEFFKGRVRVYGASGATGATVAIFED